MSLPSSCSPARGARTNNFVWKPTTPPRGAFLLMPDDLFGHGIECHSLEEAKEKQKAYQTLRGKTSTIYRRCHE
jgi:hypothetical protein